MGTALTTGASASSGAAGALKLCVYITLNDTTPTENVKVLAPGAAGQHGSFVLKGSAANMTTRFKVRRFGLAFTSFPVTGPGAEHVTVTLGSQTRALNLTLPKGSNVSQEKGCTPR